MIGQIIPPGPYGSHHDPVVLPDLEVAAMLEYSRSVPTGQVLGKRWKCFVFGERYQRQYVPHPDPKCIGIATHPLLTATEAGELAAAILWWLPW